MSKLFDVSEKTENSVDISGMSPADAKEYIFNFLSTLKLTEKQILNLDDEINKWQSRIDLANSKNESQLALDAEKEKNRLLGKKTALETEVEQYKQQIEEMRRQMLRWKS